MRKMKLLPTALAVGCALTSVSALAEISSQELENRIRDIENRLSGQYADDQQPMALTPESELPTGVVFSGYARYGAHYQGGDNKYAELDGSYNGKAAIGRLGNEDNGGEFQFDKFFASDSGAKWNITLMLDHWGSEVNVKKFYAGGTNIFESYPQAYVWAGRDFHQRPQQGINDYMWMAHDGQGGGIKNIDMGPASLSFAVIAGIEKDGDAMKGGDDGHYAITTGFEGFNLGPATLDLYANYGYADKSIDVGDRLHIYQLAAKLHGGWKHGYNQLIMRYTNNGDNSTLWGVEDLETYYVSLEGNYQVSDALDVQYLGSYHSYVVDGSSVLTDDRTNFGLIVRPTYAWNNTHSTWLEMGYQRVEFDQSSSANQGWKTTLSQNIHLDLSKDVVPMLRFYVTYADVDNKATKADSINDGDTLSFGAMWEAWW